MYFQLCLIIFWVSPDIEDIYWTMGKNPSKEVNSNNFLWISKLLLEFLIWPSPFIKFENFNLDLFFFFRAYYDFWEQHSPKCNLLVLPPFVFLRIKLFGHFVWWFGTSAHTKCRIWSTTTTTICSSQIANLPFFFFFLWPK